MPFIAPRRFASSGFEVVARSLMQQDTLPLTEVVDPDRLQQVFTEHGVSFGQEPDAVYTPALVLWALLSQAFHAAEHRSCKAAVARIASLWAALGRRVCDTNTGAYCKARLKVPAEAIAELTRRVANDAETAAEPGGATPRGVDPDGHGFLAEALKIPRPGRILMVDGTTITAADTPENQAEYPQNPAQEEGLGFPILRCVGLVSLTTGLLVDWAFGPYCGKQTGETALLRQLLNGLNAGDILVADSYYCSYWLMAECQHRGVELVAKNHHLRDGRPAAATPINDRERWSVWTRPSRPTWMSDVEYARVPKTLTVRLVDVAIGDAHLRPDAFTIATTIHEPETYRGDWIRALYRSRWLIELDIRALKCSVGLDQLRAKSPAMVRTEMWSCLLAYNLVRVKMLQAAKPKRRAPRTMSFTTTLQMLAANWVLCGVIGVTDELAELGQSMPRSERVGHRPDRHEPRENKRRPKTLKLMVKPRRVQRSESRAVGWRKSSNGMRQCHSFLTPFPRPFSAPVFDAERAGHDDRR